MRVVGLTGGIACGKSTVSGYLAEQGIPVIDGDAVSRRLTAPGGRALPAIRAAFGDGFFLPDGSLDRRKLGARVFSDPPSLEKLDRVMAPFLEEDIGSALRALQSAGAPLCFLDLPLLFEKGYDARCDSVWCVVLPPPLQLKRLMDRDRCTEEAALARIRAVLPTEEKARRSNVVIDNSGSVDETLARVAVLLREELGRCGAPPGRRRRMDRYEPETVPDPAPADAAAAPAVSAPPKASEAPVIERSGRTRRRPSARKVAWKLPPWLMAALITVSSLLAVAFTAQCLMAAYLSNQKALHESEQRKIDAEYPVLYQDLIERYAAAYNLSPAYVTAIIRNESSFRPNAESSAGARGLMQLMPDTAEWIAQKEGVSGYAFERMYDPETNIRFGCWYLNYLSRLFSGDPVSVTCAYHAGQGTVASWLSDGRLSTDGIHLSITRLPEGPTRQYAERVTRDYGIYLQKVYSPHAQPADDPARRTES